MNDALDLSGLDAFCQEYKPEIFARATIGNQAAKDMTIYPKVRDEMVLSELVSTNLVQGWSKDFNPAGEEFTFPNRTLKVRPGKVDLEIYPQVIYQSWMGKLTEGGFSKKELPFEKFLLDYIVAKVQEEPTRPTTAAGLFDGFGQIVADEIAATNITPYVSGNITVSNAYDVVRSLFKTAPVFMQNKPCNMYMGIPVFQDYLDDYQATIGAAVFNSSFDGTQKLTVPGSGGLWKICPEAAWTSSKGIICSPKENMIHGTMLDKDINMIEVQKFNRGMKIMIDFLYGVQIYSLQMVHTNDQF
jgi:hypothetical protein